MLAETGACCCARGVCGGGAVAGVAGSLGLWGVWNEPSLVLSGMALCSRLESSISGSLLLTRAVIVFSLWRTGRDRDGLVCTSAWKRVV